MDFVDIDIESSSSCDYDFLEVSWCIHIYIYIRGDASLMFVTFKGDRVLQGIGIQYSRKFAGFIY